MMFYQWLWWQIVASEMERTILGYLEDNFEEYPPSDRDMVYAELCWMIYIGSVEVNNV